MEAATLKITHHCRVRYLQRFSSEKEKYIHIDCCQDDDCWSCRSLNYEIRRKIRFNLAEIDSEIGNRLSLASEERSFINNTSFMHEYYEKYGYERFTFFWHEDVVFVIKNENEMQVIITCIPMERCIISAVRNRYVFTRRVKKERRLYRTPKKSKLATVQSRSSLNRTECWWKKDVIDSDSNTENKTL